MVSCNIYSRSIVDVRDYGAICDGVADDTAAVQSCLDAAYEQGKAMLISGVCRTIATVGLDKTFDTLRNGRTFPTIMGTKSPASAYGYGVIDGSAILADGAFVALSIKAARGAGKSGFCGGTIRDLSIIHKGGFKQDTDSTGLRLENCYDYRLFNVSCIGFGTGFHNIYGWSWDAYGLTCTGNHVGVLLDDNSNAVGIHGLQAHGNVYGVRVLSGDVQISKATLEGQKVGLVVTYGGQAYPPPSVTLSHAHFEQVSECAVQVGTDIDGTAATGRAARVTVEHMAYSNSNQVPIFKVDHVGNFTVSSFAIGSQPGVWQLGDDIGKMRFNDVDIAGDVSYMLGEDSQRANLGHATTHNLIPNGMSLSGNYAGIMQYGTLITTTAETYDGAPCIKVSCPSFAASYMGFSMPIMIAPNRAPSTSSPVALVASFRLVMDADFGVSLSFFSVSAVGVETNIKNAGNLQSLAVDATGARRVSVNVPLRTDTVRVVGKFAITNTSGATKNLRFSNIVATDRNASITTGALDVIHGLSGRLTATPGVLVQTVTLAQYKASEYEVVVTPYFSGSVYATKADGYFTATFSGAGSCSYMVIPRIGVMQ